MTEDEEKAYDEWADSIIAENERLREFALYVLTHSRIWGGEAARFTKRAEEVLGNDDQRQATG